MSLGAMGVQVIWSDYKDKVQAFFFSYQMHFFGDGWEIAMWKQTQLEISE